MVTQLSTAELDHEVPGLLVGTSVVALVPATELRGWASEMAWAIARAAAASGRRTVLVDCFVNAPTLGMSGEAAAEGIVDAFEYGASLNRIVQQQPQADLFFIPSGTYASDAEPLMQHPRWKRLSAGFRHEEALLLLYVAAEHLAGLAAEPDGVIVLAPQGAATAASDVPALAEAVAKGLPLIAVVAEKAQVQAAVAAVPVIETRPEMPVSETTAESASPRISQRRSAPMSLLISEPPGANWGVWMALVLLLAAVSGGAWWMIARRQAAADAAAVAVADSMRVLAAREAALAPAQRPVVPLPYGVQVATVRSLDEALRLSDTLSVHGVASMIASIRLPGRGTIHRVHAGPFSTQAEADSALAALRAGGLLAASAGAVTNVPLSLALAGGLTLAQADSERVRLREAGVPAFILGQASGFRLYAGAYDADAQAALLQDVLTPTGSAGDLVPRTGYVP